MGTDFENKKYKKAYGKVFRYSQKLFLGNWRKSGCCLVLFLIIIAYGCTQERRIVITPDTGAKKPEEVKRVNLEVTGKKVIRTRGGASVAISVANKGDQELLFSLPWTVDRSQIKLYDDKGNRYDFAGGIPTHRFYYNEGVKQGEWITLSPGTKTELVAEFNFSGWGKVSEQGEKFTFSIRYTIMDQTRKNVKDYIKSITLP
jgi:hypothetical protein